MDATAPTLRTVFVPVYDTGIGREAGFESDEALVAAAAAERATWPESIRSRVGRAEDHAFLFGGPVIEVTPKAFAAAYFGQPNDT